MSDQEKAEVYKEALETILMSGHGSQATSDPVVMLSAVLKIAWNALNKAGDIDAD